MLMQAAVLIVSIFENMSLTPRSSFNCQNKDEKKNNKISRKLVRSRSHSVLPPAHT